MSVKMSTGRRIFAWVVVAAAIIFTLNNLRVLMVGLGAAWTAIKAWLNY